MFSANKDSDLSAGHTLASVFAAPKNTELETSYDFDSNISKLPVSNIATLASNNQPQSVPAGFTPCCSSTPTSSTNSQSSNPSLKLFLVKVVQCFIFKDSKYTSYGRLAAAFLGNTDIKHFQIILYRDKKDHITRSYVTSKYWFGVQENNYVSFFDCNNVIWTLMFDSKCDLAEFCIEVILAKWVCLANRDTIIVQNVVVEENTKTVKQFDNIQINFIAWPLDNSGKQLKDSLSKGSETLILSLENEWEKHVIGITDNSRKLLILPAGRMGPWEKISGVSCKFGILLDVTVKIVEYNQNLPKQPLMNIDDKIVLPKLHFNDDDSDVQIPKKALKSKIDKTYEYMSSEISSPKKSELISRMGRLGKALPLKGAKMPAVPDCYDTEEDTSSPYSDAVNQKICKTRMQKTKPKPVILPSVQQVHQIVPSYPSHHPSLLPTIPVTAYPSTLTAYTPVALSPVVDTQLVVLFSEIRTHNSELRMALNSVADKIDKVVDKIQIGSMDKILQFVENMDREVTNRCTFLGESNAQRNKHLLKNNSVEDIIENELDSEKIKQIQKENDDLKDKLAMLEKQAKEFQDKICSFEAENNELQSQLEVENETSAQLRKESINSVIDFHGKLAESNLSAIYQCDSKVQSLEQIINGLSVTFDNMNLSSSSSDKNDQSDSTKITNIMNNLYKLLKSQFKADTKYTSAQIFDTYQNVFESNF
ncbi:FK506-binding protein 15-like [Lycorma delicatula]|uniref:FK506-binding protein 15-like n=1 Tax=Lycorma delicatula TaxID=130591 RepID=UPI003F516DE1